MDEHEAATVSSRAWVELLHAEVGYLLGQANIPVLHIQGPTVARWLYPDGGRDSPRLAVVRGGPLAVLSRAARRNPGYRIIHRDHRFAADTARQLWNEVAA